MSPEDADLGAEAPEVPSGTEGGDAQGGDGSGDNPAWGDIRSALDETTYSLIKPHLSKFDREAQQRITSLNDKFSWAGKLVESGATPESVEQAYGLAGRIRENPLGVFGELRDYLEEYYPDDYAKLEWVAKAQAAAEGQEPPVGDEAGNIPPELQEKIDELARGQERQAQFLEQQAEAQMMKDMQAQIDTEFNALKASRPDLQDADWKEIFGYAAAQTQIQNKPVSLTDAAQWFDSISNRIRTAPRAGDSAPDLLGGGSGGNPTAPRATDLTKLSSSELEEWIAADMDSKNKAGQN
jgi:hypothetical protein